LSPGLAEFNHRVEEPELRNFLEEHCTDFRKRDKYVKIKINDKISIHFFI